MVIRKRQTNKTQLDRDAKLVLLIEAIKIEHPFWGYRRVWATLRYRQGIEINIKRVERVMRLYGLGVQRAALKAKRTPTRSKPRPEKPCQWWGIDMTKILTESGWVYVVFVIDWYSKKIVGHHAGYQSKTSDWMMALNMAVNNEFPHGVRDEGLSLMSDNGCQPTSTTFMRDCGYLGIKQAFTSYNNPKGNADTERAIRTAKEELLWLHEWRGLDHIIARLSSWVDDFNNNYLHSSIGLKTPNMVHNGADKNRNNTPLKAA